MLKKKYVFLKFLIILLIVYNFILLKYSDKLIDKIIVNSSLIGLLLTLLSYLFKKFYIFELCHIEYAILMILIPLISNNKYILTFHFLNGLIAIITRKIFNGCLLHKVQKKRIISPPINWNIIFPILTAISFIKINFIKK